MKELKDLKNMILNLSDEEVRNFTKDSRCENISEKRNFLFIKMRRKMEENDILNSELLEGLIIDNLYYKKYGIILPPNTTIKEAFYIDKDKMIEGNNIPTEYVLQTLINWRLNLTFFKQEYLSSPKLKDLDDEFSFNPLEIVSKSYFYSQILTNEIQKEDPSSNEKNLYTYVKLIFRKVLDTFEIIDSLPKETTSLRIEFLVGDIHTICQKVVTDKSWRQANDLPMFYDRIFFGKIPDYSGLLNAFLYGYGLLKNTSLSFIQSKALLANGKYKNYEEYVYSNAFLDIRVEEVEKLVGLSLYSGSLWIESKWVFSSLNDEKKEQMSREELYYCLSRILFGILLPARRDLKDESIESLGTSLSTFFKLIEHLKNVMKYPIHWLSSYLENICHGELSSAAKPPLQSPNPIIEQYDIKTKVPFRLDCFLVEFRTLCSIWLPKLNIGLSLKPSLVFPDLQSLKKISIKIELTDELFGEALGAADSPVLGIAIESGDIVPYSEELSLIDLKERFTSNLHKDKIHTFTTFTFNAKFSQSSLLLYEADLERMLKAESRCYLFRTDSWKSISKTQALRLSKIESVTVFS